MSSAEQDARLEWLPMAQDDYLGIPESDQDPVRDVLGYLGLLTEFPPPINPAEDKGSLVRADRNDWWIARAANGYDVYVRPVSEPDEPLRLELGQIRKDTVERRDTRISRAVLDALAQLALEDNDHAQ